MVDFKNEQLYRQDSIDKQLKITFDSGTITNFDIPSEEFELTESLTSESQLVFGSCEASEIKFRIYNVFLPLKDKWLTVLQTLNGDTSSTLQIGKYKVYSDKPTADRGYRDVVAYDSMYDIINTDVASWYNSLTFPMSLKSFRDSFFAFFGIEQEEVSLVNDNMEIERTIDVQVLSGRDVIQSICQINGCFGHIGRDGKFKYVFLETISGGLYPSNDIYPANNLFPQETNVQIVGKGLYVDTPTYEDFTVKPIDKLQIREKEGDIGVVVGNGNNTYIVEDNFLVYGKSTEDLTLIANGMLSVIEGLEYRPFDATLVGNPCIEVGDGVRLHTKYQIIDSYVLQRTLSGVQALRDNFTAEGEEYQSEKVNDIQTEIKQLKGKSNTLERTIEETRSTISNMEEGLQSEITQTAESIRLEVADNTGKISTIEQTVDGITQRVEDVNKDLSAEIETNANQIALKVAKGDVSSQLSVEKDQVTISGNRLVVDATNFSLSSDGKMSCNEAEITGTIKGSSGEFTKSFSVNVPLGTLRKWLMNADENGTNIGFADSSGNFYSLLKLTEGNAELSGQSGVEINGGKGSVNIYATAPISLQSSVIVSGSLTMSNDVLFNGQTGPFSINMNKHLIRYYNSADGYCTAIGNNDYPTRIYGKSVWSNGTIDQSSDSRLKEDIADLSEYEESFMKLKPISYKWVKESELYDSEQCVDDKKHIGFIAQEVESAFNNDDLAIHNKHGDVHTLAYSEFIALNTHMIQQAYKKIETQQQEIDTLKEQVSFLMKKLGDDVNG